MDSVKLDFHHAHVYVTLIWFLIISVIEAMSTSTCTGSNERFVDGTCYRFYSRPASWFDAKLLCEGQGDILASVKSFHQIKEILKNQSLQTEAWIGATDYVIEGNYLWIQNNQLANNDLTPLWDLREPNNENHNSREDEDCVSLYANCTVNDAPCSFKFPYICMDTMKLTGLYSLQINCPDGKFGYKCRYMCQCAINIACDKMTGFCISGLCKVGYWGPGCQLDDKCFYNQQPKKYVGMQSSTKNNLTCQHWNKKNPHGHSRTLSEFLDRRLPDNYCRVTPDEDKPWCYTTSSEVRWEFCPVESCACPLGRYDIYCNKDCHCKNSNEQCNEVTGECKSGCAMGWTGKDCQTVIPCEPNKYGWECEKNCYCENSSHCERFLGATSHCVLSKPMIVHFENNLALPGQASTFTCTVQANPPPKDDEIQMFGPQGKNITSLSSRILESSTLRRTKIFYVTSVGENEQYTCSVQSELGSNHLTVVADLSGAPPKCPTEISLSRIDDLVIMSWKPMKNTERNQHFEVLVFKSTGNLTPVNAREGTIIAVIQNLTSGTFEYRYNTSGLSSSDPLVFTIIASNDYGKVECNTTIIDGIATDFHKTFWSYQNIAIITGSAATLLVGIQIVSIICIIKERRRKQKLRMLQYDQMALKELELDDHQYERLSKMADSGQGSKDI